MDPIELYQRFLASTVDFALIHASVDGTIEAWLGASERVLGYRAEEVVGKSLSLFFTEEDRRRGLDAHEIALALTQGRSEDDRWHLRKNGTTFWASGVLGTLEDDNGKPIGLYKMLRDRTDVRTQIEDLEHQVESLAKAHDLQRHAMSTLAHEIRNPLMPITSALALLQHPNASQFAARATQVLVNQVDVLKRLLDDLNAASAHPSSVRSLSRTPVNLTRVLTELVDTLQEEATQRSQTLSLVVPIPDITLSADSPRLQQMLLNLLNNALKYTGQSGRIVVSASIEADMAVIRIEDNGVGIGPDVLPRIFDLFTREGRSPEVQGSGVGLAVVKQLATAHGGFVEARSAGAGKGSMFTLRLPLLPAA